MPWGLYCGKLFPLTEIFHLEDWFIGYFQWRNLQNRKNKPEAGQFFSFWTWHRNCLTDTCGVCVILQGTQFKTLLIFRQTVSNTDWLKLLKQRCGRADGWFNYMRIYWELFSAPSKQSPCIIPDSHVKGFLLFVSNEGDQINNVKHEMTAFLHFFLFLLAAIVLL